MLIKSGRALLSLGGISSFVWALAVNVLKATPFKLAQVLAFSPVHDTGIGEQNHLQCHEKWHIKSFFQGVGMVPILLNKLFLSSFYRY